MRFRCEGAPSGGISISIHGSIPAVEICRPPLSFHSNASDQRMRVSLIVLLVLAASVHCQFLVAVVVVAHAVHCVGFDFAVVRRIRFDHF